MGSKTHSIPRLVTPEFKDTAEMRNTPIISLGYALASLSVVQATSFVTVTKTVIKDTLVGNVNSAPLTSTLDRRSFVEPTTVLTLKTKDEAFVFTTRLAFDGLEGPGHYPTPEDSHPILTPTGWEVEQEDTPPNAMSTEASDPESGEHSTLDSAKGTRAIAARSPSDDLDDNPDDDAPHWPKTIALPTRSAMYEGPTRDVRATIPIAPPPPKITILPTAIPTDWPHPIGPDQDPADPGRPVKIPVIYNSDYEDPESKTVAWTAHHYCDVFPHPMSLCTNEAWIKEHQLHTTPPAKAALVQRAEATPDHYCDLFAHPMSLCTNEAWIKEHQLPTTPPAKAPLVQRAEATPSAVDAGVMTGSVVISPATVTAASTATAY
ncbi:hypothetical protein D6D21_10516 [Aureobasidium pullulans]|uniref:Uncharacterized protein n=1 Tax=Aureobasidium pullulans TaxID=5580 RepID=A0AB74IHP7_AURPU|nr:hypothetical protein D6D21_10516 [Aureobasidium pullulans]